MTRMKSLTVLAVALGCLAFSSAASDDITSVKLSRKPLNKELLAKQRKNIKAKLLNSAANGGEDIPLVDFMDAQVSCPSCPCSRITLTQAADLPR